MPPRLAISTIAAAAPATGGNRGARAPSAEREEVARPTAYVGREGEEECQRREGEPQKRHLPERQPGKVARDERHADEEGRPQDGETGATQRHGREPRAFGLGSARIGERGQDREAAGGQHRTEQMAAQEEAQRTGLAR